MLVTSFLHVTLPTPSFLITTIAIPAASCVTGPVGSHTFIVIAAVARYDFPLYLKSQNSPQRHHRKAHDLEMPVYFEVWAGGFRVSRCDF